MNYFFVFLLLTVQELLPPSTLVSTRHGCVICLAKQLAPNFSEYRFIPSIHRFFGRHLGLNSSWLQLHSRSRICHLRSSRHSSKPLDFASAKSVTSGTPIVSRISLVSSSAQTMTFVVPSKMVHTTHLHAIHGHFLVCHFPVFISPNHFLRHFPVKLY